MRDSAMTSKSDSRLVLSPYTFIVITVEPVKSDSESQAS